MKRVAFKMLGGLLVVAGAVYLGDYAVLRYRIFRGQAPYGSVTVNAYYAVPQKTGKTEYDFDSTQQETCVNSLFPHISYEPCWYLRKHTDKKIQL